MSAEPAEPTPKTDAGGGFEDSVLVARMAHLMSGTVVGARLISDRSLSLKLYLKKGTNAVFKPMLKNSQRAKYEVAAYQLARMLGLDGVPPSTMRRLKVAQLERMIARDSPERAREFAMGIKTDRDHRVWGAVIEWVDGLQREGLKVLGGKAGLFKPLSIDADASAVPELVPDVAAMVVFDFLIGNWDRFSGGNFFLTPSSSEITFELVLIDNNGSFAPWSNRQRDRMLKQLRRTERFPAGLIDQLRNLRAEDVRAALRREPRHRIDALLSEVEIDLLLGRRDILIEHVDKLIASHGRAAVLPFP